MPISDIPSAFRIQIDTALERYLPAENLVPERLHSAMRYAVLAPGKRLRPALALASSLAVGGTIEAALPGACALEMVHVFSLIHDDLPAIDNDDLRRGRPTCHRQFDEATAILAGDALFALAFQILAESPVSFEQRTSAMHELARQSGSSGVVGGEVLDIESEGQAPDLASLLTIHRQKTGALMAASCAIGGILGGGTLGQIEDLRDYGAALGLAFQIVDDILNETSTVEALGKAVGSDRALGKMTYPALMGTDAATREAERLAGSALEYLHSLPGDTTWLRDLASFAVQRQR
ncbi:MAG: polyprenyl synthetase family protein [Fimbriimonadaceae bacterium]|nr:polyprenyl synthetase family protein [Fimbriimonadaceae bacterium]